MGSGSEFYRSIFDQFDLNGDGHISRNELLVAFQSAGVTVSDDRLDKALLEADIDASGGLDFAEFVAILQAFARSSAPTTTAAAAAAAAAAAVDSKMSDEALRRLEDIFGAAVGDSGFDLVGSDELRGLLAASASGQSVVELTADEAVAIETIARALNNRSVDFDEFLELWRAACTGNE